MNAQYVIFTIFFQLLTLKTQVQPVLHGPSIRLFGTTFLFVLKFFGEIVILLLISAAISHILKLDKFYENSVNK